VNKIAQSDLKDAKSLAGAEFAWGGINVTLASWDGSTAISSSSSHTVMSLQRN